MAAEPDLLSHVTFTAPAFLDDVPPEVPAPAQDPAGATGEPADTAPGPAEAVPPGERLARALEAALASRGWATPYRWATPYGHAFEARRAEHRYDLEIAPVDLALGSWLVTAVPRRGLFRRFFGGGVDREEHALLLAHLRSALALDLDVPAPRWFDEEGWRASPRGPGAELPLA